MSTITKRELIDRIAESTQVKRALVKATIQNVFDEVISELAKDQAMFLALQVRIEFLVGPEPMSAYGGLSLHQANTIVPAT